MVAVKHFDHAVQRFAISAVSGELPPYAGGLHGHGVVDPVRS